MEKATDLIFPNIDLDRNSRVPIRLQLAEKIKLEIADFRLMAGQLLPSTRQLANIVGISRPTAVRVYEDLIAQGYIETVEGTGTYVRKRLSTETTLAHRQEIEIEFTASASHSLQTDALKLTAHDYPELNHGCAPKDLLPLGQWKNCWLQSYRKLERSSIDYGTDPFGYAPLRDAIRKYLERSRMIQIPSEQLLICVSSTYFLKLISETLIQSGDCVVIPEPGPIYAREIFQALQAKLIPVEVDDKGMKVEALQELSAPPKCLYINSSHQEPNGACLSLERRQDLVRWAQVNNVILIEDDFDAEYRYGANPLPPLKALSQADNVVYIANFWKTLYPLVNVSYMVTPVALIPVLQKAWHQSPSEFHTNFSFIDQLALITLLEQGDYEKHLRQTRDVYASRWRSCVLELTRNFGNAIEIAREASAFQLFLKLEVADHHTILASAQAAGLGLLTADANYLLDSSHNTFVLPFAHLPENEMGARLARFRQLITAAVGT
jgi:GntR family transcriptional regulator/MocR family aminotransferase